jgi:tRNA dimethylallyltransferase
VSAFDLHTLDTTRDTRVSSSWLRSQRVVGRGAPPAVTKLHYDVVAIFGPTTSGKSAVARLVARALGTDVVSADALQVYRGLPILTNQPPEPTLLVGIRDVSDTMSVGEYAALAHDAIDNLADSRGAAVVAGGTGLYLRAALADLDIPPAVAGPERARIEALYDSDPAAAHARLTRLDPEAAGAVHVNDRRRVVRALELAAAGSTLAPRGNLLWAESTRRPTLIVGLDVPADVLERRIVSRTDEMIGRGVADEVRRAARSPISYTARQALGLDELATLPIDDAREAIVVRTRRYAAYQRKWMRRIPGVVLIHADRPAEEVADAVLDVARAR